jgi:predicted RND superfamily exporter protein
VTIAARSLSAIAGAAARRPLLVLALALALGLGGAALALRLHPSAATDTFVGRSSSGYRATQSFYRSFGEEPIDVVVRGNLQLLLESSDIDRLVGLEGCLSGNVPPAGLPREGGANGPCGALARLRSVKVVIGPGTFVNEAAEQLDRVLSSQSAKAETQAGLAQRAIERAALAKGRDAAEAHQLGAEASKLTLENYAQQLELLGATYGITAPPELNSPSFVSRLVFDNTAKLPGTPKQRFAYLFPSRETALISVRLKAGLDEARRTRTIEQIRRAVAMPQWRLQHGEHYLITGEPVIVADLASSIAHSIELLLVAVLLVMALTLGLVFNGRPRLLPLAIAALATALTFGALAAAGAALTVAQVAVLPVLVGLAVDYAIQFQSRVQEARDTGAHVEDAIRHAAASAGPTIAAAAAAAGAALLVLALSPVPTVRGFGLLLVCGIAIAFTCALTAGSAALALSARRMHRTPARRSWAARAGRRLGPSWHGARELLRENPLTRAISRAALVHAVRNPGRVLGVGLALAALGWALDTQTHVETNLEKLVPQNMASLRNLSTLERASGVGGEIDLMVSSAQLATPATIEWMGSYESSILRRFGYTATRGCGKALLCPAFSLPDLFNGGALGSAAGAGAAGAAGVGTGAAGGGTGAASGGAAKTGGAAKLTRAEIRALLAAIPAYFSQDVLSADRRVATLAFGIRLMPLDEQQRVIEAMRADLHPPRGVSVQLVGLPVLAAQSGAVVASPWRRVLTLLAGLAAAALVLLAAFRGNRRRALAPLLPVALATGWSALIVFAIRVPLNPMSVTLSALVIAVSTEFSVLLAERHRQERLAGHDMLEALRRTYGYTGAAVAASGVTAIMGFGVLVLSDIAMLRDFGVVTLVDLSASLVGVLVALPAALLLAEPGGLTTRLPRRAPLRRHARVRPRDEPA